MYTISTREILNLGPPMSTLGIYRLLKDVGVVGPKLVFDHHPNEEAGEDVAAMWARQDAQRLDSVRDLVTDEQIPLIDVFRKIECSFGSYARETMLKIFCIKFPDDPLVREYTFWCVYQFRGFMGPGHREDLKIVREAITTKRKGWEFSMLKGCRNSCISFYAVTRMVLFDEGSLEDYIKNNAHMAVSRLFSEKPEDTLGVIDKLLFTRNDFVDAIDTRMTMKLLDCLEAGKWTGENYDL